MDAFSAFEDGRLSPSDILSDECPHENRDYDEGNYVAPYGWEIYPGWYCLDCGEMLDEEEVDPDHGYDPDLARKYELEDEMRNPL